MRGEKQSFNGRIGEKIIKTEQYPVDSHAWHLYIFELACKASSLF